MKRAEMQKLIDGVLSGEMRAIAKTLTVCENDPEGSIDLVRSLYSRGGRAHVIGITGAPGAGKSTLVDRLALKWHEGGKKVAILAVDPSSPFSGGAILGDRIRMHNTAAYPDIFIRSMASRGVLGGLARAAYDAVTVLDAAGFDIVMVETVGVGQGEVDIVRTAQSCLVVLVPGMGDEVQAFKAGILEIADLFVINKSDHLGADNLERDILTLLSLEESQEGAWKPKVLRTVATKGDGVAELCEKIAAHKEWLSSSPKAAEKRRAMVRDTILQLSSFAFERRILRSKGKRLSELTEKCLEREISPGLAAQELLKELP